MIGVLMIGLLGCAPQPAPAPAPAAPVKAAYRSVDLAAFKADFYDGKVPLLVDVRNPDEYAAGHVPGARNIPLDQVESRVAELDSFKNGPVYLICESGGRSARASQLLAGRGYQAVNVQGGTYAWRNAGLPTER